MPRHKVSSLRSNRDNKPAPAQWGLSSFGSVKGWLFLSVPSTVRCVWDLHYMYLVDTCLHHSPSCQHPFILVHFILYIYMYYDINYSKMFHIHISYVQFKRPILGDAAALTLLGVRKTGGSRRFNWQPSCQIHSCQFTASIYIAVCFLHVKNTQSMLGKWYDDFHNANGASWKGWGKWKHCLTQEISGEETTGCMISTGGTQGILWPFGACLAISTLVDIRIDRRNKVVPQLESFNPQTQGPPWNSY